MKGNMSKICCITGITGQTGSHLAESLLKDDFKVYGLIRRTSSFNTQRIDHLYTDPHINNKLELVYGDLSDFSSIVSLVADTKPDYFFNLAAQSHVRVSFDLPEYTMDINATGVVRCLEAIRKYSPTTRFLQASSSEQFGSNSPPQNEKTPFQARSIYGVSKIAAFHSVVNYREAYNLFACNSISFNHEGSRRTPTFFPRKVTMAASRIKLGLQECAWFGYLNSRRSWTDARDVVKAMRMIIDHSAPDDFAVGREEMHSGKELIEMVFGKLGLDWAKCIRTDQRYFRPSEVEALRPDTTKIKNTLGWKPEISFERMIDEMIEHDMELARQEKLLKENQGKIKVINS